MAEVLIFTDWYLPGYKAGGPITSVSTLVETIGHRVDCFVVCSDRDYGSREPYPGIAYGAWQPLGRARVRYLAPGEQRRKVYADLMRARPGAAVHINGIFSPAFSIKPLLVARSLQRRIVLSPRGMLAPAALALKRLKKRAYLRLALRLGCFEGLTFHATSAAEVRQIRQCLGADKPVVTAANLPRFVAGGLPPKKTNSLRLLIVGRIAPEKNILGALRVLQQLPPTIRVEASLAGASYGEPYARACRKRIAQLPAHVDLQWLGAVAPAELDRLYSSHHLFFLPTLGENFGHAIAEALSAGLPVLISDRTPWKDLEQRGWGLSAPPGDITTFVAYITELAAMNEDLYRQRVAPIGPSFRRYVNSGTDVATYISLFS